MRRLRRLRAFLSVIVVLLAVIALSIAALRWCVVSGREGATLALQCLIPFLCILLAGILVSLPGKIVRSKSLLTVMFFMLVGFGIWVFSGATELNGSSWTHRLFFPFNSTLAALFPSRGDYDIFDHAVRCAVCGSQTNAEPNYRHVTWFLIFHSCSYLYFAWLAFSIFGRKILSRLIIHVIPNRNKNLIWGFSEGAFELAKDMIAQTDDAEPVFILDDEIEFDYEREGLIFDRLSNEGILAFSTSCAKSESYRYFSGHRHYFITENQDFNVKMALMTLEHLSRNVGRIGDKVHLFVRTELDGTDAFFQQKLDDNEALKKKTEVHIFNQSDIAARQFVDEYPVLGLSKVTNPNTGRKWLDINTELLQVEGEVNILLLGLGWIGYEMMKKLVNDAQFLGDYKVNLIIIDDNYKQHHGRYQYIAQEARKFGVNICINPLVWIDAEHRICRQWLYGEHCSKDEDLEEKYIHQANSQLFYEWLGFVDPNDGIRNILRFNRIVVALGNDELNVNTALQLTNFRYHYLGAKEANDASLMPEPIFAHVRDKEKYDYYENTRNTVIHVFGGLKTIYNVKNLVDEKLDTIARLVNHVYSQYAVERFTEEQLRADIAAGKVIEEEWAGCSIFDQDSSRAVAMNIKNLITLSGGDIETFTRMVDEEFYIERFSELEHKRWNAFHYMRGIGTWEMDEVQPIQLSGDKKPKARGKLSFNKSLVRHICLVDYDELNAATRRVHILGNTGEDFKASDRRIIRHFPIFYKILNENK